MAKNQKKVFLSLLILQKFISQLISAIDKVTPDFLIIFVIFKRTKEALKYNGLLCMSHDNFVI